MTKVTPRRLEIIEIISFTERVNFFFLDLIVFTYRKIKLKHASTEFIVSLNHSCTSILENSICWYLTIKIVIKQIQ